MAGIRIHAIDHVQLAMPRGGEERARAFYAGVLGLQEVPKPPNSPSRRSLVRARHVKFTSVEDDFRAAKKAHPALVVEGLAEIIARCEQGEYRAMPDVPLLDTGACTWKIRLATVWN